MLKCSYLSREKHSSRAAYRKILQYIHEHDVQVGDRLPTHADLASELEICHATLASAMKWLVEDEVLIRKQKLGTILSASYPKYPKRSIWQVGIVIPPLTSSYFVPVFIHYLHKHLGRKGCTDRVYMLRPDATPSDEVMERHPDDFSGLAEDLESGLLHAVLTSTRLVTDQVPMCSFLGMRNSGVAIDHRTYVKEAIAALKETGCRKLWAGVSPLDDGYGHMFEECLDELAHHAGVAVKEIICPSGVEYGYRLAHKILQTKPVERPDGLIFKDDITAQACVALLAREGLKEIHVAVQTNLQVPLSFAIVPIAFALDVDELARVSVDQLMDRLLRPGVVPRSHLIIPRRQRGGYGNGESYRPVSGIGNHSKKSLERYE